MARHNKNDVDIILLDELNTCSKFMWHLIENMDGSYWCKYNKTLKGKI